MQTEEPPKPEVDPTLRLYSIRSIVLASAISTCFAGSVLLWSNFRRLGRVEDARKAVQFGLLGCVALVVVILVVEIPSNIETFCRFTIDAIQAGAVSLYATKTFGPTAREYELAGAKFHSAWRAVGFALPLTTVPLALIFLAIAVFPNAPAVTPADEFHWGVVDHTSPDFQERGIVTWDQFRSELANYPWQAELRNAIRSRDFNPTIAVANSRLQRILTVELTTGPEGDVYYCSWGKDDSLANHLVIAAGSMEAVTSLYEKFFHRNIAPLDTLFIDSGVKRRDLIGRQARESHIPEGAAP